jgi:hypothetical protein
VERTGINIRSLTPSAPSRGKNWHQYPQPDPFGINRGKNWHQYPQPDPFGAPSLRRLPDQRNLVFRGEIEPTKMG